MTTQAQTRRFARLLIPLALSVAVFGSTAPQVSSASELAAARGVYPGFDRGDRFAAHESLLGSSISWAVHMADLESPADMRGSVWGQLAKPGAYLPQVASRLDLVMTVPLAFGSGRVRTEEDRLRVRDKLEETATGIWDADYRIVANHLIDNGFRDAVIRLGHEFDGVYYPWTARGNEDAYIEAFRHVHDVLAAESSDFRFEWTGMRSTFSRFGPQAYPGDAYVDVVGMDIYYRQPAALTTDVWESQYLSELEFHRDFAIARGKPVAYSEWGVGLYDQPAFIDAMYSWFSSLPDEGPGRLVYQSYFSPPREGYDLGDHPMSQRRYVELFGDADTSSPPSTTPVTVPPVAVPPVTVPPVTVPPVTVPPVTVPPVVEPIAVGAVMNLTDADVCTLVGRAVEAFATEPPATGFFPSTGPICVAYSRSTAGVQFDRRGPQGPSSVATMQGQLLTDVDIAGRLAVVTDFSEMKQLVVWLGTDSDPALVVYAHTVDTAVIVAEAVVAQLTEETAAASRSR